MNRLMGASVLAACVAAFSVTAMAQDEKKPPAKEHSMTGCLQKGSAANTFVVSNTEKGPKLIGITESKDNLAPHVGHKMTITGVDVPAKEAESATPKPDKADHYMKLSAAKMVSATCP